MTLLIKTLAIVAVLIGGLTSPVLAGPPTFIYPVTLDRVVDGDTMDFRMEIFPSIYKDARIRVANFDAAETWRPSTEAERAHGQAATERAIELLQPPLHIRVYGWGVLNRVRADIILPDGLDFATVMIEEGYEKRDEYFYPQQE